MPVKRTRIGSPSGHKAMQVSTDDAATVNVNSSAIRKAGERSKILDIGCPAAVGESDQVKIGGFLERCHYCKKRIALNSEVFMYSNLCAFCSAECRDCQIALDLSANKQPAKPNVKAP